MIDGHTVCVTVWHPALLVMVTACVLRLLQQLRCPITHVSAAAGEGVLLTMLQQLCVLAQLKGHKTQLTTGQLCCEIDCNASLTLN